MNNPYPIDSIGSPRKLFIRDDLLVDECREIVARFPHTPAIWKTLPDEAVCGPGFLSYFWPYPTSLREALVTQLRGVVRKAAEDGWDGQGSVAVKIGAVKIAEKICETLPTFIPDPDIDAMPTGEVSYDWEKGESTLTLLVSEDGYLYYSSDRENGERSRGRKQWLGRLPASILQEIRDLYDEKG